jgi:hypothetical protein
MFTHTFILLSALVFVGSALPDEPQIQNLDAAGLIAGEYLLVLNEAENDADHMKYVDGVITFCIKQ